MNDSAFNSPSTDETSLEEDQSQDKEPRFGVVDIVEAFTAMRHDLRGQTKESRELSEQIQAAVSSLESLEAKLLAQVAVSSTDETRALAKLIANTDHQLTRAVHAIEQTERNRERREAADHEAIVRCFEEMNAIARWFARPLFSLICEQRQTQGSGTENPAIEGLNLVLARIRQAMREQQIERIDVEGQPFDANIMNSIGTVDSADYPSGHIAEQLAPCYRWQGQILQFADVRVAKSSSQRTESS